MTLTNWLHLKDHLFHHIFCKTYILAQWTYIAITHFNVKLGEQVQAAENETKVARYTT